MAQLFVELHATPAVTQTIATERLALSWPMMCLSSSLRFRVGSFQTWEILTLCSLILDGVEMVGIDANVACNIQRLSAISRALSSVFSNSARAAAWRKGRRSR